MCQLHIIRRGTVIASAQGLILHLNFNLPSTELLGMSKIDSWQFVTLWQYDSAVWH